MSVVVWFSFSSLLIHLTLRDMLGFIRVNLVLSTRSLVLLRILLLRYLVAARERRDGRLKAFSEGMGKDLRGKLLLLLLL